jgi:Kef-type K+ transport system membrane component KefB
MDVFVQIAIVIGVTIFFAFLARLFKQPLIISYIASGIIIGPYFLSLMSSFEILEVFSEMGIALLLFIVGLGLSPKVIKEVGKVSLITGVGQVLFTSIIGFAIGTALGFDFVSSSYIAIALTFSSTIIIMKLVSDRGDTETLYGKIAIGFLIVQDLIVMLMLVIVTSIPAGGGINSILLVTLAQGLVLILAVMFIGFKILPKAMDFISKSQEFLLLFSIGWCFIIAAIFQQANLGIEIGALIAGFTLAVSPFRIEISSKLKAIRDFFLVLFFISLGAGLAFGNITNYIIPIIIFSIFILIGNPLIVMTLMGFLGHTKRNGFMAGLTVAQISEFSIILIALGIRSGHLSEFVFNGVTIPGQDVLLIVTAIGLITIAGSSYLIMYSDKIFPHIEKYLNVFERKRKVVDENKEEKYDAILFGCNRIGHDILRALQKTKSKFIVVEYNPEKIRDFEKKGIDVVYGDVNDIEFLDELPLKNTKIIVSTVPEFSTNYLLLRKLKKENRNAIIIMVSYDADDAIKLYDDGATYVVIPHFLGGHFTATMIETHGTDLNRFLREKLNHIKYLEQRRKIAPEHFKQKK